MAAVEARIAFRGAGVLAHVRLALLVLAGCVGCAQPGRPPVAERSPVFEAGESGTYRVTPGDTLYSIAWRFELDHKALARANGIRPPYVIYVGQSIRLGTAPARPPGQETAKPPERPAREKPPPERPAVALSGWRAPTEAPVGRGYGRGNRGIDYALAADHRVRAAAAGEVVYAGSGLGGFRHLVIVKHSSEYLSAYSLNRPMAVGEGEKVKAGQLLAGTPRAGTLHFEIRRHGEPVDPGSLIGR